MILAAQSLCGPTISDEVFQGPEDTESAWRGGVRKDGEGGRVRGFQGKWTESRGFQFGGVMERRGGLEKNRLREKK